MRKPIAYASLLLALGFVFAAAVLLANRWNTQIGPGKAVGSIALRAAASAVDSLENEAANPALLPAESDRWQMPLTSAKVISILPSPSYSEDQTLYILTASELFRSRDGGATWEIADHWPEWGTRLAHGTILDAGQGRAALMSITTAGELRRDALAAIEWLPYDELVDPYNTVPGEWDTAEALAFLFDKTAIPFYAEQVTSRIYNGEQQMLLLLRDARTSDCHDCRLQFHVAKFTQNGFGWSLAKLSFIVADILIQEWAQLETTSVQIGPERNGFVIYSDRRTAEGAYTDITILGELGDGTFGTVFETKGREVGPRVFTCTGDVQRACYETITEFEFVPGSDENYYDLHVVTSGTTMAGNRVEPIDEYVVYVFDGTRYSLPEASDSTGTTEIESD